MSWSILNFDMRLQRFPKPEPLAGVILRSRLALPLGRLANVVSGWTWQPMETQQTWANAISEKHMFLLWEWLPCLRNVWNLNVAKDITTKLTERIRFYATVAENLGSRYNAHKLEDGRNTSYWIHLNPNVCTTVKCVIISDCNVKQVLAARESFNLLIYSYGFSVRTGE